MQPEDWLSDVPTDLLGYDALRDPETYAEYYRFGAEYLWQVSDAMEFEHGGLEAPLNEAYDAMSENRTDDVSPLASRSVASILLGDADWFVRFPEWQESPKSEQTLLRFLPLVRALRSVGRRYAGTLDEDAVATYSRPEAVRVDGAPALSYVGGARRMILATSILHLEWYVDVARAHGVEVPQDLVDQTREESKRYFSGRSDHLSDRVEEFQFWLFQDAEWIRDFESTYGGGTDSASASKSRTGSADILERVAVTELA